MKQISRTRIIFYEIKPWGWRDGSVVKSTGGGPKSNPKHSQGSSQTYVTPDLGIHVYFGLHRHETQILCTDT